MWNGTSHALEIFRISATNICGQVASSRNPAWGVKKITDILDKKQACGGSVLCCFSPLLCMYSIYICKYVSCKHKLLIWYQGPNCWFFIHVLFFLLRSTLGKRKPSTWVQKSRQQKNRFTEPSSGLLGDEGWVVVFVIVAAEQSTAKRDSCFEVWYRIPKHQPTMKPIEPSLNHQLKLLGD